MATKEMTRRDRIHLRIRKVVNGTAKCPRLAVYRSSKEIYAQLVDDENGTTLAMVSSLSKNGEPLTGSKTEQAAQVGKKMAEAAMAKGIDCVAFDRGGFLYHGRVKALAEGAREGGLKF
ncbi:MAG: 50S ribosomal protein L18 [Schleiferiaceae bacterium]|nr:50S ribosomal protein L18 [Schleiferiaceae bacterium]